MIHPRGLSYAMRLLFQFVVGASLFATIQVASTTETTQPPKSLDDISDQKLEQARIAASRGYVIRRGTELVLWLDDDKSRGVTFRNWETKKGDRDDAEYELLSNAPQHFVIGLHYAHDAPGLFVVHRRSGQLQEYFIGDETVYESPSQQRVISIRASDLALKKPLIKIVSTGGSVFETELVCQAPNYAKLAALSDDLIAIDWQETASSTRSVTFARTNGRWAAVNGESIKGLICH